MVRILAFWMGITHVLFFRAIGLILCTECLSALAWGVFVLPQLPGVRTRAGIALVFRAVTVQPRVARVGAAGTLGVID